MKVYKALANTILARKNCKESGNKEWYDRHGDRIKKIMAGAPSGSGFDDGTQLDKKSNSERLLFHFGYHHMDENGYYTHWTHHDVIVLGSLVFGFILQIRDAESEDDLDYFHEVFGYWLDEEWNPPN